MFRQSIGHVRSGLQKQHRSLSLYRTFSVAAEPSAQEIDPVEPVPPQSNSSNLRNIRAGLLLSRIPIVTPELSEFEKAYYHYQEELERRLMWTFPSYYYFRRGTLSERQFMAAHRGPVANNPKIYFSRGKPDILHNRERRAKQEVRLAQRDEGDDKLFGNTTQSDSDILTRKIVPNPRTTEADEENITTSLIRKLDRTLYLVVETPKGWRLPSFGLNEKETLHEAAERGIRELGGENINTWTVSKTPAAFGRFDIENRNIDANSVNEQTVREFYIKSHILHGQFTPENLNFGWFTTEEFKERADSAYFDNVEQLLAKI
jgi:large subunit ribosomal protein L46